MFSFFKIVFGPLFPNCRIGVGRPILETSLCLKKLCGVMDESQFLKGEITEHLQSLEKEVERYFRKLS